jgi:hypothetical protein
MQLYLANVKNNKFCKYIYYEELITQQSLIEDANTTEE